MWGPFNVGRIGCLGQFSIDIRAKKNYTITIGLIEISSFTHKMRLRHG